MPPENGNGDKVKVDVAVHGVEIETLQKTVDEIKNYLFDKHSAHHEKLETRINGIDKRASLISVIGASITAAIIIIARTFFGK